MAFTPGYPVLTKRLALRRWTMGDFDALHAILSDEGVARYLYWDAKTPAETRELLAQRVGQYRLDDRNDVLTLAADDRETGQLVGSGMVKWASRADEQGELGYILSPAHYGRGYATEIAIALLRLGFEGAHMHRIVGRCDARNIASARVLEKAGLRREAHLVENEYVKGEWTSELVYALLAREWFNRR